MTVNVAPDTVQIGQELEEPGSSSQAADAVFGSAAVICLCFESLAQSVADALPCRQ